jgi:cytochrome c oxidase subunit 3
MSYNGETPKPTDTINGAIVAGVLFSGIQGYEYYNAPFTTADSIFGSAFTLLLTPMHPCARWAYYIANSRKRLQHLHLSPKHHVGFLAAI